MTYLEGALELFKEIRGRHSRGGSLQFEEVSMEDSGLWTVVGSLSMSIIGQKMNDFNQAKPEPSNLQEGLTLKVFLRMVMELSLPQRHSRAGGCPSPVCE